ncbi:MAG: hypothetical protein KatS3mg111_2226 [Pirellulaceae bacterium]|nr:MAG: hypothetical protein KatS3mg111_2226 [Pirellulaceae bacterium]
MESFTPLPAFVDGGWRGGSSLPDPQLGWCLLTATGGHVGNDLQHAVVRRWHAPRAGRINIGGRLAHRRPEGDGVRGSILVDGKRVGEWLVHNDSVATLIPTATVKKGSTIDFVTDCRGSVSHDSFDWKVVVRYGDGEREEYDSQQQFPEPVAPPLDAWGQLAQVLLCTNELMFID